MQRTPTTTRTTRPILILFLLVALIVSVSTVNPVLAMPEVTVTSEVWIDNNCNGIREIDEPHRSNQTVYLFAAGDDNIINTADDQVIEQSTTGTGPLRFTVGTTDLDYALVVLKKDQPADLFPGPLNAGDDRTIDNDMRHDLWATNGFRMSETETVTGIDIGLCQVQLTPRLYMPAIWR